MLLSWLGHPPVFLFSDPGTSRHCLLPRVGGIARPGVVGPCRSRVGLYSGIETLEGLQEERSDLLGFMCCCEHSHCRGQGWKEGDRGGTIAMTQVGELYYLGQGGGDGGGTKGVRVWV